MLLGAGGSKVRTGCSFGRGGRRVDPWDGGSIRGKSVATGGEGMIGVVRGRRIGFFFDFDSIRNRIVSISAHCKTRPFRFTDEAGCPRRAAP